DGMIDQFAGIGVGQHRPSGDARFGQAFPGKLLETFGGALARYPHDRNRAAAGVGGKRVNRLHYFLAFAADPSSGVRPICCQNIFCTWPQPSMLAGSHVLSMVSGSSERIFSASCISISFIRASCMGATSGRPKNARASCGVHSISNLTFMI